MTRTAARRPARIGRVLSGLALAALPWLGSCASAPPPAPAPTPTAPAPEMLDETPVPEGPFREHRLSRCVEGSEVPAVVEKYLGLSSEYFRDGSGSDGMIELELGLAAGHRHPLMLLTLGQLYLLAGQGDPDLLPNEGPAADVGSYARNKPRLLGRARELLREAQSGRPDDAAIDYLLADVARTMGRADRADSLVAAAAGKCTGGRSFRILQMYQGLYQHPPRYLGGPAANYPQRAVQRGLEGDVVFDLLLGPSGEVRQYVVVASPDELLTRAAWDSVRASRFEPGRVGKYAVWSWLRITTPFALNP
jgi:TonB family protein